MGGYIKTEGAVAGDGIVGFRGAGGIEDCWQVSSFYRSISEQRECRMQKKGKSKRERERERSIRVWADWVSESTRALGWVVSILAELCD